MKKSNLERLKKILSLWNALHAQVTQRNITKEALLTDEFASGQLQPQSTILENRSTSFPWN